MENSDKKEFSLVYLLVVTGVCCLCFTLAMKILDGVTNQLFLKAGLVSLGLGVLGFFVNRLTEKLETPDQSAGAE